MMALLIDALVEDVHEALSIARRADWEQTVCVLRLRFPSGHDLVLNAEGTLGVTVCLVDWLSPHGISAASSAGVSVWLERGR